MGGKETYSLPVCHAHEKAKRKTYYHTTLHTHTTYYKLRFFTTTTTTTTCLLLHRTVHSYTFCIYVFLSSISVYIMYLTSNNRQTQAHALLPCPALCLSISYISTPSTSPPSLPTHTTYLCLPSPTSISSTCPLPPSPCHTCLFSSSLCLLSSSISLSFSSF